MAGLIRIIAAVLSSFALFWAGLGAGLWWDRRPEGVPTLHVKVLFWPVNITAPESLKAKGQRAAADLGECQRNEAAYSRALVAQDAAVGRLKAAGDARAQAAEKAAQEAQTSRRIALARVAAIQAFPETGGACEAADALIKETVR